MVTRLTLMLALFAFTASAMQGNRMFRRLEKQPKCL